MRNKILTVDDSKTVRVIVKNAFKPYDCEILEASNGVEGLALAGKELPSLILLDVTMPVMDGVETLTKLKSDAQLKSIPVLMLTAEGGRDQVIKIAKIGVRDYVIKPFKEDVLIEKAGRIIELKPLTEGTVRAKSITDPAMILVVDDKPAIIEQIKQGLKHTPWTVHGVATSGEAIDCCTLSPPDMIIISLSLPEESAFSLFRALRSTVKTKFTPVFGLVVKTDTVALQQAQMVGYSTIITKPIDLLDLEARMAKAMNLDTSQRYFSVDDSFLTMTIPDNSSQAVLTEVSVYLKPRFSEAVDAGIGRAIIDLRALKGLHMGIIKLLVQTMQTCRELGMSYALLGNVQLANDCRGFEDTKNWRFLESMEEARNSLSAGGRADEA
jgi:two-component system cell cycle response regulator